MPFNRFLFDLNSTGNQFDLASLEICRALDMISCYRVEVLKKPKVPVILFVDEFRKLAEYCNMHYPMKHQESSVLTSIGSALHTADQHTVLVSTLDHTPLLDNSTKLPCFSCAVSFLICCCGSNKLIVWTHR